MHTHWCPVDGCRAYETCDGRNCPAVVLCGRHADWEPCADCGNYVAEVKQEGHGITRFCAECLKMVEPFPLAGSWFLSEVRAGTMPDALATAGRRARALARATRMALQRASAVESPGPVGDETNATFKTYVVYPDHPRIMTVSVIRCATRIEREMAGQIIGVLVSAIKEVGLPMMLAFLTGAAADLLIEEGQMSHTVADELIRLTAESNCDTVCTSA